MELKDNSQRAQWVVWSFIAMGVMLLLFGFSSFSQYDLLERIKTGGDFTDEEAQANDLRHSLIAIVYLVTYVASIVLFILWFRRAYFNLHVISPNTMQFTEGWAAGAWFVPLLNLVRPFQIMKEIWYDTHRHTDSERRHSFGILGFWWATFLITGIYDRIISKAYDGDSVEQLMSLSWHTGLFSLLRLIPLILTVIIIKRISKAEETLREKYHTLDISSHLVDDNTTKAY